MALYSKLFASVYDRVLSFPEKKVLSKKRKELLSALSGNILEAGCGTGVNFPLYSKKARVLACDPSEAMLEKSEKRMIREKINAEIELIRGGITDKELALRIKPSSLDAVVCTLVLCTIPAPEKVLKQLYNWLKPGGKLILLEHIRSKSKSGNILQDLITPVWKHLAEGCHLNRATDEIAKEAGFLVEKENYFRYLVPFYEAELVKPA